MKIKLSIATAAVCLGVFSLQAAPVSAASSVGGLTQSSVATTAEANPVQLVASRKYNRNEHGQRYRSRHKGYDHYHDGYWYATPWWTAAAVGGAIGGAVLGGVANTVQGVGNAVTGGAAGGNHVAWCQERYRTYDPSTDTYVGRGGVKRQCESPY
ncbi:hypothetical protein FHS85_002253 [Rhodoligotrophos appendicifer]|uniref:BA14K family protein n=1 Tax=Rhodoligotrophos appendicifer TaxID=987056 RepID=UPI001186A552|nr:BA14K family protein [Rhodoligotrophos appendicifer]